MPNATDQLVDSFVTKFKASGVVIRPEEHVSMSLKHIYLSGCPNLLQASYRGTRFQPSTHVESRFLIGTRLQMDISERRRVL
jgi:hypothetical protein